MKLRISSSKLTAFRKDITRFLPLWALYFVGGVLVMLTITSSTRPHYAAESLNEVIGPFAWINLIYAALCAQLLFGDLFNSRLCNALHAMPLRREDWFFSHLAAGFAFSLVPNTVGIALVMPRLGQYWYTGLLWLAGMELHFLFFFGLAVFSIMCTGNRFAMVAVYGILNFFSMLAQWFAVTIYQPMLYGVVLNTEPFTLFCPVMKLSDDAGDYFWLEKIYGFGNDPDTYIYGFGGFGENWGYLAILAVLGIVLLAVSLLMYRRRALECAGDFMAASGMKPVFLLVYTLCFGAVFALFGDIFGNSYVAFLIVGIAVGFFTGHMLLQRTVRIFKLKTFIGFGVLAAVMVASLFLTKLDLFGIARWQPQPSQVKSVRISTDSSVRYYNALTFTDEKQIGEVIHIHKLVIDEGEPDGRKETMTVNIRYTLTDGREVTRIYHPARDSAFFDPMKELFGRPENVLGYTDWETFVEDVQAISVSGMNHDVVKQKQNIRSLLEAMKADCEAGNLAQAWQFYNDTDTKLWISLERYNSEGDYFGKEIQIFDCAKHTLEWVKENMPGVLEHDK